MKTLPASRALVALAALWLAVSPGLAATTVNPALSASAFTDIGGGPMLLGGGPGGVVYVQADSQPSIGTAGFVVQPGDPPACIGGTAHVWARATTSVGTTAVVSAGSGIACAGSSPASTASARNFPGCTVGVTSAQCLGTAAQTFVQIQNASASASIACAWGVTAVLNASSSVQLAPGQPASWGPDTAGIPSGVLNCISSAASTPLYLEWN